jgi:ANTAR domain
LANPWWRLQVSAQRRETRLWIEVVFRTKSSVCISIAFQLDRAKGILQRDLSLSEDEAYRAMQTEGRQRRKSMREIGEAKHVKTAVGDADQGRRNKI